MLPLSITQTVKSLRDKVTGNGGGVFQFLQSEAIHAGILTHKKRPKCFNPLPRVGDVPRLLPRVSQDHHILGHLPEFRHLGRIVHPEEAIPIARNLPVAGASFFGLRNSKMRVCGMMVSIFFWAGLLDRVESELRQMNRRPPLSPRETPRQSERHPALVAGPRRSTTHRRTVSRVAFRHFPCKRRDGGKESPNNRPTHRCPTEQGTSSATTCRAMPNHGT